MWETAITSIKLRYCERSRRPEEQQACRREYEGWRYEIIYGLYSVWAIGTASSVATCSQRKGAAVIKCSGPLLWCLAKRCRISECCERQSTCIEVKDIVNTAIVSSAITYLWEETSRSLYGRRIGAATILTSAEERKSGISAINGSKERWICSGSIIQISYVASMNPASAS